MSSGSAGQWTIVSAEHGTGDDGGIYFYTLTATAGSQAVNPVAPPAPADTLPIAALTGSLSTAAASIDAGSLTAMAQDTMPSPNRSIRGPSPRPHSFTS